MEKGRWIALKCITSNGGLAHSSPVYVSRDGYKTWNREKLPQIVEKYLSFLEREKGDIAGYKSALENNQIGQTDLERLHIAKHADEFMQELDHLKQDYLKILEDFRNE